MIPTTVGTSLGKYSVPGEVFFQEVQGEIVLLNLNSGYYYGLNAVASRMWQLLRGGGDAESVMRTIHEEYEVSGEILHDDIKLFADQLCSTGLLIREDE